MLCSSVQFLKQYANFDSAYVTYESFTWDLTYQLLSITIRTPIAVISNCVQYRLVLCSIDIPLLRLSVTKVSSRLSK